MGLFTNSITHNYATNAGNGLSGIFPSSGACLTINNQTFIYYFDCTSYYLVKNNASGYYMAKLKFSSTCFLLRSSSTYLYVTGGKQIFIIDYNLNQVQNYTSTCGTSACLQSSTGIYLDSTTNLIYAADGSSNYIFIYSSSLVQLRYVNLASYLPSYPVADIVTYNGYLYAMSYTGTTTSRIWVINNSSTVIATFTSFCGANGVAVYPFIMNCNGYILMPCSTPNAVYLYSNNGSYVSNLKLTYPSNGITVDTNGRLVSVITGYTSIIEIIT